MVLFLPLSKEKATSCHCLVYTCGGIFTSSGTSRAAAGEEMGKESGGQAQAAGGFEQDAGVAGGEAARIRQ